MSTYELTGIAAIAGQSAPSAIEKSSDHELTGRLSRGGFAKILWSALEEVAPHQRSQLADAWCEQLMHVAKLRRINWWPSLGSATTAVAVSSSAVQVALEEVLDATPSPHRRAKEETAAKNDDAALSAALRGGASLV